jgi:hypothetical protein
MSWNRKSARAVHSVVGLLWGGMLLTACGGSPNELRNGFQQPGEEQLIQQTAALGGEQSYTARSQGYDDLLVHRTGFALDGNVVGSGVDARVYIVDKTTDDGSVGTLRHALESTQPYWIRFAPALAGQSITVTSSIEVQSNKTIDGRVNYAQPVRIKTNASSGHVVKALIFEGKTQLIVTTAGRQTPRGARRSTSSSRTASGCTRTGSRASAMWPSRWTCPSAIWSR